LRRDHGGALGLVGDVDVEVHLARDGRQVRHHSLAVARVAHQDPVLRQNWRLLPGKVCQIFREWTPYSNDLLIKKGKFIGYITDKAR
jgi:hypothetical protein